MKNTLMFTNHIILNKPINNNKMINEDKQRVLNLSGITGTVEFFENMFVSKQIHIFKYRRVYQLCYSRNAGYYMLECKPLRLIRGNYVLRGRFVAYDYKQANNLIEREFFVG